MQKPRLLLICSGLLMSFMVLGQKPREFSAAPEKLPEELQAYFKGALKAFDVELDFQDASPFQQKVWTALTQIPYGKTISYLDLALKVGTEKHTRAVGLANGKNPIPSLCPVTG